MLCDDNIVVKALLDQRILDRLQRLLDIEATLFKLLFGNVWQGYLTILSRRADVGRSGREIFEICAAAGMPRVTPSPRLRR
jgi:hypothetical protein